MSKDSNLERLEKLIWDYNSHEVLKAMIFYHFIGPEELRFSINELICGLAVKSRIVNSKYIFSFKEYNKIIEKAEKIFERIAIEKLELAILHKDDTLEEKKKLETSFFQK